MSRIESFNKDTGFYKAIHIIDAFVWTTNFMIAIVGVICFILVKIGIVPSLPEWISGYNLGIKMSANAMLLLVLNNGHNRYYSIYSKYLELSVLGNTLDLMIKITLAGATILQVIADKAIILFATIAYILTFFRNLELLSTLEEKNPLRGHVKTAWIPNNIRHNVVMLLFCIFFYLIEFKIVYFAASWLMNSTMNMSFFNSETFGAIHNGLIFMYVLFFDVYWMHRVLRKIKISKSNFFKMNPMNKLAKSMEAYNEAKVK